MRRLSRLFLVLAVFVSAGSALHAQPEILKIQAGFKPLGDEKGPSHKVGLWSPLAVRLAHSIDLHVNASSALLHVETEDNEDFTVDWKSSWVDERFTVPFKPGRTRGDLRVFIENMNAMITASPPVEGVSSGVNAYLYAILGAKLDDLADALTLKERRAAEDGKFVAPPNRFAVYEDDADCLPERHAFAYDSYDLIVLNTGNRAFLQQVNASRAEPLRRWVANGGRLVIAIEPKNVDLVREFLGKTLPVAFGDSAIAFKNLSPVESWAGLQDKPFPARGESPALVTPMTLGPGWDVIAEIYDKKVGDRPVPLIARSPLGFGAVTLIAFPLDGGAFPRWSGRVDFLRALVDQLGPRYQMAEKTKTTALAEQDAVGDLGTQLHRDLDVFDVSTPSFAMVAFLMLAYILLVSVVDYAVLKRLGRLEATWFTLPILAALVCGFVYWALAPNDDRHLRTNAVALVDYDLRGEPALTRPTTFLTVRSPAIRELTLSTPTQTSFVKVPPPQAGDPRSPLIDGIERLPAIGWFGRPDDGPAGMGRGGSQSLGTKTYFYQRAFGTLHKVPFAYRGTKAFLSSGLYDAPPPFAADVVYHARTHHLKVSGTIENKLSCDLEEAYLFVFDRAYPIEGGLKAGQKVSIAIKEIENGLLPGEWRDKPDLGRPATSRGDYNPCRALRNIMFHERLDGRLAKSNHLFRPLDWSWRLRDDPRVVNVPISSLGTREAILIARAKFALGDAAKLAADSASPLPTVLNVDDRPEGLLSQDTYVRVIVPMRPQP